ncbi:VTT domain-containing protein [uncultured Maritimibacter sp.]|jgi:membrane protein DedA with SNARE-associated domain|uniref:DedA family protein n=1 Tax=uncultured Maritimibacter sp. TaxID=991866 RepID=UPI002636CD12|nr:VTT domain-containing protein [uncultured Maritimibacter sp.]
MSDTLVALVPTYGLVLLGLATFLSCIAVPMPASLIMLAGGAFAAGGDLESIPVWLACWVGAVVGDQAGYGIGHRGAALIDRIEAQYPARAVVLARARNFTAKWGAVGVFLSRWLVSPLGPYVNLLSGASRTDWRVFTLWSALGEVIWVSIYVGLGYVFSSNIAEIAQIAGNFSGLLVALLLAGLLGRIIWTRVVEDEGEAELDPT